MIASTKILISIFVVLVVALLVGQRLGFVWAGGLGYEAPMSLMTLEVVNGDQALSYPRGSVIETGPGNWVSLSNEGMSIWLYENTRLEVKQLNKHQVELAVPRGRLVIVNNTPSRTVTIIAGDTTTTIEHQPLSIVNYDFLHKVDVFPVYADEATKTGAASDFYQWVQSSND